MKKLGILVVVVVIAVVVATVSPIYSAGQRERPRRSGGKIRPDSLKLTKGTVVFHGGYETDRRDGGRPVVLIAAALGVESQVFRDAFSGVRPSRNGPPSGEQARANKQVLMAALAKYGVSNDRLDEVSDYYRYRPEGGELWKHVPAEAKSRIENGEVVGIELTRAGSGYSSTPRIEIVGYPNAHVDVTLEYGSDLSTNGRVETMKLKK